MVKVSTNMASSLLQLCICYNYNYYTATTLQLYYPKDVDITPAGELLVAEHHSIRLISLPGVTSISAGIQSEGRVTTLAGGGNEEGERDGNVNGSASELEARFNGPAGVAAAQDGTVYVVDSVRSVMQ
jgi:hypothetical protein